LILNKPLPAVASEPKKATEPAVLPPSMTKVALPAVEGPTKKTIAVPPPFTVKVPFPAVALLLKPIAAPFPKSSAAPLTTNVPLPALLILEKKIAPPLPNDPVPPRRVKKVSSPAVALFVRLRSLFFSITKFWSIPELFMIPVPLIVKVLPSVTLIVKPLAPGLKTSSLTSVELEIVTLV
jgi:hypothetical protein